MQSLRRRFSSAPLRRGGAVDSRIPWVRDRALDHVVEREKYLRPFISLKDHFLSASPSPPHSLPLSSITPLKSDLSLPFRAIQFIRLFPSAFSETLPSPPLPPVPQIQPTQELLSLHEDELQTTALSQSDLADRLLKLLMLSPSRSLPLSLVQRLRWDLGLPTDFVTSILPNYPDYFATSSSSNRSEINLEVVYYRKDLAVSAMESYAKRTGEYKKGSPLAFPLHFSTNCTLDKKARKWFDDWQRLPYHCPYEGGSHLTLKREIAEKWTVGVLHEALSLFIGKKTEKSNLVLLGEKLRLPPGFRRAIMNHPGIFYVSNKLKTETVVLREGYRRHMLIEKHPVMDVRYRYMHLMHQGKTAGVKGGEKKKVTEFGKERESEFGDLHEDDEEFDEEEYEDEDEDESDDDTDEHVEGSGSVTKGVDQFQNVRRGVNTRQRRMQNC